MIRHGLIAIALIATPTAAQRPTATNGPTAAAQAAAANAQQALALVENRPCPNLGDTGYVSGVGDAARLAAASSRELSTASTALMTLQRMLQDPELTPKGQGELRFLGSWTVAAAMARWTLLRIAEQGLVDPVITRGGRHPSTLLGETAAQLQDLAGNGALTPDSAELLSRLKRGADRCRGVNIAAVLAANERDALAAISGATSTSALTAVSQTYMLQRGGPSATEAQFDARYRTLEQQEARAAQRNRPVAAAVPDGPSPAQMAVAKRFIAASNRQDSAAALSELSEDVELRTPQGNFRGKAQVKQAVQQQAASGRSGTTGEPRMSNGVIIAPGRVGAIPITTRFYFNDAGKIRLLIVN